MKATEPLPLFHSWPLTERPRQFELGRLLDGPMTDLPGPSGPAPLPVPLSGSWTCDLSDNSLVWSGGVYDIFGFPRGSSVSREAAAALYGEDSRAAMERLRAHAIRHRRGFTLDAEIRPLGGGRRWMRLIAAPVCHGGQVVGLHGLKIII